MDGVDETAEMYLKKRGFSVVRDVQELGGDFPYVSLSDTREFYDNYQIMLHLSRSKTVCVGDSDGIQHPCRREPEELADTIASFIAEQEALDGTAFGLQEGKPIPLFVIDPRWDETVDILAERYPAQGDDNV